MSSRTISGEPAKAAPAITWARSGSPQMGLPTARPTYSPRPQVRPVGTETDGGIEGLLAEARNAGRLEAESALKTQLAAQADAIYTRLGRTIQGLSAYKSSLRRDAEQDVVRLAIAVARKILQREIAVDADALLGLVKVALDKIEARELHRVRVHPEHSQALQRALQSIGAPRQVEVFGDPSLERGAAIFETSRGSLDVSVETQLREIERGFADLVARR